MRRQSHNVHIDESPISLEFYMWQNSSSKIKVKNYIPWWKFGLSGRLDQWDTLKEILNTNEYKDANFKAYE